MESKCKYYKARKQWELPDGTIHREGGPAVMYYGGDIEWRINGLLHRLDGPAITFDEDEEWYINGQPVTYQIHLWAKEFNIDLDNLTDEDKQMIALYWADYGK